MDVFTPSTLAYLTQAGWQPGRKISLIKYRAYLDGEGYAWFPAVASFLSEFGDLLITFKRNSGGVDTMSFDACDAGDSFDTYWVQKNYAPRIGQSQLCVIGVAYGHHLLLFMDEAGRVYGGYDDFLCFIGNSGPEAIEAICSNHRSQEIPE
ncbi:MAG TPA: SUKH-3 domain-containing protein [Candidatus Obscuribacterales bacterium]